MVSILKVKIKTFGFTLSFSALASQIFIKLDDGEIVSEVGFKHWRDNGEEQQGHGVMRSNLKLFFEELSNNDSDSDNSETPSKA